MPCATPRLRSSPRRDECLPLEGAKELVVELNRRRFVVVMASSAGPDDLEFSSSESE